MENGPDLYHLLQRLQNCPAEFLLPPKLEGSPKTYVGKIQTGAVVNDLLFEFGIYTNPGEIYKTFQYKYSAENKNYLQLILIAIHLLSDYWFLSYSRKLGEKVNHLLGGKLKNLASAVNADQFVMDSERREELIRFCLKELNLKPAGETDIQANDRLTTIDSLERIKLIEQSKAAQKRAQELRDAMARQEAEEAASKMNRE